MSSMFFVTADPGQHVDTDELMERVDSPHSLPPMGEEVEFANDLSDRAAAAGLGTGPVDRETGIAAIEHVDNIKTSVHGGQVRWILVNGGTGELVDVLKAMGAARGQVWRFVDGGTQEEWRP